MIRGHGRAGIVLYVLLFFALAGGALLFVRERETAQREEEARTSKATVDALISQCKLLRGDVNDIIDALKIVTAGEETPQSDIGARLFAAIDALQVKSVADCQATIP